MALNVMPQAPTVSGVYQVRDFVPQLNEATKSASNALQNAFKFGTQVHDYKIQRDQEKLINDENKRQTLLKENLENDKVLLAKLEKELQDLKAGKDVELRSGLEKLQQNNVPEMQKKVDMLNSLDNNTMKWNWANVANMGGENG